jgi:hypothetical protein
MPQKEKPKQMKAIGEHDFFGEIFQETSSGDFGIQIQIPLFR